MANPKLPGIPEAEQALLYAKLNEYTGASWSYKEAGPDLCSAKTGTSHLLGLDLFAYTREEQTFVYSRTLSRHQRITADGKHAVFLFQALPADCGIQ